jgi:hypothetical protein
MNPQKASRQDWKTQPIPDIKAKLKIERIFTKAEYECLSWGLIPINMEEKWFIYFEDEWLYCHRSWTGFCIYQLRLEKNDDGYKVSEAWVNRDSKQYTGDNESYDVKSLLGLINLIIQNNRSNHLQKL